MRKVALQWESWCLAVYFSFPGKHLFDHSVDYTWFYSERKICSDPTEGGLWKIDIVNDTMTGRFDVVISNVKAPNGVFEVFLYRSGQKQVVKMTFVWYTANCQANEPIMLM